MVDDNLQAQHMTPPPSKPPDKRQQICKMNKKPNIDEYAIDSSENEIDGDNHSLEEVDENDATSESLIKAFSPHNDQTLEDEIQQVPLNQCLSPRGFHQDKFHFKKQDANTFTVGRPNTRLLSSRYSQ